MSPKTKKKAVKKKATKKEDKKQKSDEKDEKKKKPPTVASVLAGIYKDFGSDSVKPLGVKSSEEIPVISAGSLKVDEIMGPGGLPRGRIIEMFGWEGGGKTFCANCVIASAQKLDELCLFIDVERSWEPGFARRCAVVDS